MQTTFQNCIKPSFEGLHGVLKCSLFLAIFQISASAGRYINKTMSNIIRDSCLEIVLSNT